MTDQTPAPKKRHGTETRQRQKITPIRWELTEFNKVAAKANKAGLTFGAFMRALGLDGDAGARSNASRPPKKNCCCVGRASSGASTITSTRSRGALTKMNFTTFPSFA